LTEITKIEKLDYSQNEATSNLKYLSPFQGIYKLINKKIIWKAPLLPIRKILLPKRLPCITQNNEIPLPIVNQNKEHKDTEIKYAYASKTGVLLLKKINQDSAIVCSCFEGKKDKYFFAVADGHGVFGDKISTLVTSSLKSTQSLQQ